MISAELIDGTDNVSATDSAHAALVRFYAAFNQRSNNDIEACWLHSDLASMSNPLGGVKRGWQEISQVYEKIFQGPVHVYVEFYDYSIFETENMFCAVGCERGHLSVNGNRVDLKIRTSRIYCRDQNDCWKHLHHHGSMDDPELLSQYQKAVLGKASTGGTDV